jgi:hypothetical protein
MCEQLRKREKKRKQISFRKEKKREKRKTKIVIFIFIIMERIRFSSKINYRRRENVESFLAGRGW